MPHYDFSCPKCKTTDSIRRLLSEFGEPVVHACGQEMVRQFRPNSNTFIPIAFRQVLSDGSAGGGGLSWSDFHGDVTEKQLAHMPNVLPYNEYMSQPGVGDPHDHARYSRDYERPSSFAERKALGREATGEGERKRVRRKPVAADN